MTVTGHILCMKISSALLKFLAGLLILISISIPTRQKTFYSLVSVSISLLLLSPRLASLSNAPRICDVMLDKTLLYSTDDIAHLLAVHIWKRPMSFHHFLSLPVVSDENWMLVFSWLVWRVYRGAVDCAVRGEAAGESACLLRVTHSRSTESV